MRRLLTPILLITLLGASYVLYQYKQENSRLTLELSRQSDLNQKLQSQLDHELLRSQSEKSAIQNEIGRLTTQIESESGILSSLKASLQGARGGTAPSDLDPNLLAQKKALVEDLAHQIKNVQEQERSLNQSDRAAVGQNKYSEAQYENQLNQQIKDSQASVKALQTQLTQKKKQPPTYTSGDEIAQLQSQLNVAQNTLDQLQAQKTQARQTLQDTNYQQSVQVTGQRAGFQQQETSLRGQYAAEKAALDDLQRRMSAQKQMYSNRSQVVHELQRQYDAEKQKIDLIQSQLDAEKAKLEKYSQ